MLHRADAAAVRDANDERQTDASARTAAVFRHVADHLVERGVREAVELHLDDRAQPIHRHADRRPRDAGLGDWSVEAAVDAHLRLQTVGDTEDAAELADILAVHDDAVVLAHRIAERGVQRARHRELHQEVSSAAVNSWLRIARCACSCGVGVAYTWSNISRGSPAGASNRKSRMRAATTSASASTSATYASSTTPPSRSTRRNISTGSRSRHEAASSSLR